MAEKRFNIHEQMSAILGYECVFDNQKEKWLSIRDTVLCLIELAEENEQLKSELGKLHILYKAKCKTEEQLLEMGKEVEKENEQLKQLVNIADDLIDKLGSETMQNEWIKNF